MATIGRNRAVAIVGSIRLTGRSGHSSDPALGNSALEGMHLAIAELLAWRKELQQRYRNPLFAVQEPTVNLGHIHGGDNPNRICAHCELHFDISSCSLVPCHCWRDAARVSRHTLSEARLRCGDSPRSSIATRSRTSSARRSRKTSAALSTASGKKRQRKWAPTTLMMSGSIPFA